MNNKLVLFDFDGTLTSKDTMIEFIRFCKGSASLYTSYVVLFPWLIAYKAGLYSNEKAKKQLLKFHFNGKSEEWLKKKGEKFCEYELSKLFREDALAKLAFHRSKKHEVYVISASLDFWIMPWMEKQKIKCLCTGTKFENGVFTGEFSTPNCYGPEKVRRLKEVTNPEDYELIIAYGDSNGDKEMMELADNKFYRKVN